MPPYSDVDHSCFAATPSLPFSGPWTTGQTPWSEQRHAGSTSRYGRLRWNVGSTTEILLGLACPPPLFDKSCSSIQYVFAISGDTTVGPAPLRRSQWCDSSGINCRRRTVSIRSNSMALISGRYINLRVIIDTRGVVEREAGEPRAIVALRLAALIRSWPRAHRSGNHNITQAKAQASGGASASSMTSPWAEAPRAPRTSDRLGHRRSAAPPSH